MTLNTQSHRRNLKNRCFYTVSGQGPWSHWQAISTSLEPASLQAWPQYFSSDWTTHRHGRCAHLFCSVAVVMGFPFPGRYKLKFRQLSPSHRPANKCSRGDACREGGQDGEGKMLMEPMGCVIQKFVSSVAALLDGAPHHSQSILHRIGNRAGCA